MTNNEVLQCANMLSIKAMLLSRQLTWTGHVVRTNDDRLPKAVLYSKQWQAKQNVGRPPLSYMDCTKRHLHAANINKRHWEEMAHDHSAWHTAVKKGATKAKPKRATDVETKTTNLANRTNQLPEFTCQYCGRKLAARNGQLSHERSYAKKR